MKINSAIKGLSLLKRKEQKELTKKKIFEKSLELFLEKGFENVSIDYIVKEMGLTKGAFYHHFISKDAILVEYNNKILDELTGHLINTIHNNRESDALEILNAIIHTIGEYYSDNYSLLRMIIIESNKANISLQELFINEVAVFLENLLEKGTLTKQLNFRMAPNKISIYIAALVYQELKTIEKYEEVSGRKEKISRELREILDIVINGILIK